MGVRTSSLRAAVAATLCVGAMLSFDAPASAAPVSPVSNSDDVLLPAEQGAREAAPRAEKAQAQQSFDLQSLLDSFTRTFEDSVGRRVDEAVAAANQNVASQIATSIATPIANSALGVIPSAASGAGSALFLAWLNNNTSAAPSVAALLPSFAALPALSVPALPTWSAPALPAGLSLPALPAGLPQLPQLPALALALPQLPLALPELPQLPVLPLPLGLPELPQLPQLPSFGPPPLPHLTGFDIPFTTIHVF